MNRANIRASMVVIALVVALGIGAIADWTTPDGLSMNVLELLEMVDRAIYITTAGLSGYGESDSRVLAQELVNIFEGPSGEHYDETSATSADVGIMSHPLMAFTSDWAAWFQSLSGSQAALAVESLSYASMYLQVAYEAALALLEDDGGWFGKDFSWLSAYAALLAAKGDAEDPLLLPGIGHLAALDLAQATVAQAESGTPLVLQARIQETTEDGFLLLESGIYGDPAIVAKSITIRGVSPEETILEGTPWVPAIQILADDEPITVRLQNLTIRDGVTGLSTTSSGDPSVPIALELENVHFVSNESGILIGRPTQLRADGCLFQENDTAVASLWPVGEGGKSAVVLNSCRFVRNGVSASARGGDAITLRSCRILEGTDPRVDVGISDGAVLHMSDCVLQRVAGGGVTLDGTAFATLTNNTIVTPYAYGITVGPKTDDDQDCGMAVSSSTEDLPPGEVSGHGNIIEYGICPVTMRFLTDPSPEEVSVNSGESIQAAIDAVVPGGTVSINAGHYSSDLVVEKSLSMVGAGKEEVLLEAADGQRAIFVASDLRIDIDLSALTLEGDASGVGVYAQGDVSIDMRDVVIRDFGNGVSLRDGARSKAIGCSFLGNGYGASASAFGRFEAIGCVFDSNQRAVSGTMSAILKLSSCSVLGCTDSRAAISGWCTEMTLSSCTIYNNECAGVRLGGGELSTLHITDCTIRRNILGIDFVCGGCAPGGVDEYEPSHGDCEYGTVSGWANEIPGADEPDGNEEGAFFVCFPDKMPDLSFLTEPKPAGE